MAYAVDYDISISEIDSAAEDGQTQLVGLINTWWIQDSDQRLQRAAVWQQNIHFLAGDQWLRWNVTYNRWQSIPWTQSNHSIDRPVANYILVYTNSNASSFTGKPTLSIDPNSDDPRDKTGAKVASVVKDYLWEELDKDDQYDDASLWGLTCSIAFRKSIKKSTRRFANVPIPEDDPTYESEAEKQQTKEPIKRVRIRKVHAEMVSPFNLTFDALGKKFTQLSVIMEANIRRVDWIKKEYGREKGNGFTGRTDEVTADLQLTNFLSLGESLRDIIEGAPQSGSGQSGYGKGADSFKDSNVLKEIYTQPTEKHPRGRYIVIAGDILLYDSAGVVAKDSTKNISRDKDQGSPYFYLEGKVWHPYTEWTYQKLPGSIYGISLVQQLVPKQRTINSIDALVAYNRKTIGVGQVLIPTQANIPDESMIGRPGQNVTYTPGPRGEKPERLAGVPLPSQTYEERANHLEDMDRIASSADVRSGRNPKGVTTVGQLQILNENAMKTMSKPIDRWEKFIERSEQLDLLNFQSCYNIPDPYVVQKLKNLSKDLSDSDWDTFLGEEMRDNVNVRVAHRSTVVKSEVVQRETILNLAREGLLPDIVSDPFQHKLFLEKFGLTDLLTESNIDVVKAEKAIELMLQGKYIPVEEFDNPDIQLIVLARYMKKVKWLDYDDKTKLMFKRRFDEYVAKLAQANAIPDNAEEPTAGPAGAGSPTGKQTSNSATGKSKSKPPAAKAPLT